jgi:hypothetical protein
MSAGGWHWQFCVCHGQKFDTSELHWQSGFAVELAARAELQSSYVTELGLKTTVGQRELREVRATGQFEFHIAAV